jgi:hypothetical protein
MRSSDGPARVERECGEASNGNEGTGEMQGSDGDEGTAVIPVTQPSEIEDSQATPELNHSLDEVRSADPIGGTTTQSHKKAGDICVF